MTLTARRLYAFSPDNHRAEALLEELFPEYERLNMALLRFHPTINIVDYFGYYDEENRFCGFSYVIYTDKMALVLYLAVDGAMHSKGYGSEIMRQIMQRHADKEIILNCEPLDDNAENADQRRRRIRFYERMGLKVMDYQYMQPTKGEPIPYAIMSSREQLSVDEYMRLMRIYSIGLYKPKLQKVGDAG